MVRRARLVVLTLMLALIAYATPGVPARAGELGPAQSIERAQLRPLEVDPLLLDAVLFMHQVDDAAPPPRPQPPKASRGGGRAPLPPQKKAPARSGSSFLACTRSHESDTSGGYAAVSKSGKYRGAYQFDQSTWDGAAHRAGYDEYVGTPPNEVPAGAQDAVALQLHSERGNAPWGGRC